MEKIIMEIMHKINANAYTNILLKPEISKSTTDHLACKVASFLEMYPFVTRDQGYVDFLSHCGGALVGDEYDAISLGIYGFSDEFGPHLLDPPVIDDEGFFTFADLLVTYETEKGHEREVEMAFSFDATGMRTWGIYRRFIDEPDYWYTQTFIEWLEDIQECNQKLIDKKKELSDRDLLAHPKRAFERKGRIAIFEKIAA